MTFRKENFDSHCQPHKSSKSSSVILTLDEFKHCYSIFIVVVSFLERDVFWVFMMIWIIETSPAKVFVFLSPPCLPLKSQPPSQSHFLPQVTSAPQATQESDVGAAPQVTRAAHDRQAKRLAALERRADDFDFALTRAQKQVSSD